MPVESVGEKSLVPAEDRKPNSTNSIFPIPRANTVSWVMTQEQMLEISNEEQRTSFRKFFKHKIKWLEEIYAYHKNSPDAQRLILSTIVDLKTSEAACKSRNDLEALFSSFDIANEFEHKLRKKLTELFELPPNTLYFYNSKNISACAHSAFMYYNFLNQNLDGIGGIALPVSENNAIDKYAFVFKDPKIFSEFSILINTIHELSHCKEKGSYSKVNKPLWSVVQEGDQKIIEYEVLKILLSDSDEEFVAKLRGLIDNEFSKYCSNVNLNDHTSTEDKLNVIFQTENRSNLSFVYKWERDFTQRLIELSSKKAIRNYHFNQDSTLLEQELKKGMFKALEDIFKYAIENIENFSAYDSNYRFIITKLICDNILNLESISDESKYLSKLQTNTEGVKLALKTLDDTLEHSSLIKFNKMVLSVALDQTKINQCNLDRVFNILNTAIAEGHFKKEVIDSLSNIIGEPEQKEKTARESSKPKQEESFTQNIEADPDSNSDLIDITFKTISDLESKISQNIDKQKNILHLQTVVNEATLSFPHVKEFRDRYKGIQKDLTDSFIEFSEEPKFIEYKFPIQLSKSLWLCSGEDLPEFYSKDLINLKGKFFIVDTKFLELVEAPQTTKASTIPNSQSKPTDDAIFNLNRYSVNEASIAQNLEIRVNRDGKIVIKALKNISSTRPSFRLQKENASALKSILERKFDAMYSFGIFLSIDQEDLKERIRLLDLYTTLY